MNFFGKEVDDILATSRKERQEREDKEERDRRVQEDKRVAESLEYCRNVQSQYAQLEALSYFMDRQNPWNPFTSPKLFYESLAEVIERRLPSSDAIEEIQQQYRGLVERVPSFRRDAISVIKTGKSYLPVDVLAVPSFQASLSYEQQETERIIAAKELKERNQRERERKEREMAEIKARLKALETELGVA